MEVPSFKITSQQVRLFDLAKRITHGFATWREVWTNPEELIAAAHAGCFSMALSHGLSQSGFAPRRIHTTAKVHLEKTAAGFAIPRIELITEAEVPNIEEAAFHKQAETAKQNCPVSKVLAGAEITLDAKLVAR